ncbi:MAG: hypothetical protein ABI855_16205 [Bacteroidota bacterium]
MARAIASEALATAVLACAISAEVRTTAAEALAISAEDVAAAADLSERGTLLLISVFILYILNGGVKLLSLQTDMLVPNGMGCHLVYTLWMEDRKWTMDYRQGSK